MIRLPLIIFHVIFQLEEGVSLPPPDQLLYKIIIKNKKLAPDVENDLLLSGNVFMFQR